MALCTVSCSSFLSGYEKVEGARIDIIIMNSCLWDVNRCQEKIEIISFCLVLKVGPHGTD